MAVTFAPAASVVTMSPRLGVGKDAVAGRPVGGWHGRLAQYEGTDDHSRGEQADQRDHGEDEPESQRR